MGKLIPPLNRPLDLGVLKVIEVSEKEREKIMALSDDPINPQIRGRVKKSDNLNVVDINKRIVETWIIHEENEWVDNLILDCAIHANRQFGFQVTGLMERPQLLCYSAPSGGYDWHTDIGPGDASTRKISISIQLNDDFEGGELCFFSEGRQTVMMKGGDGVAFPSFMPHCVTPVTKGHRWALVCWIAGEPFQ